jgi:ATPase subunit of ABC transporter with duplicated ATPase domains
MTGVDYEAQQVAELCDTDDWDSAWQLCKELGIKWGGRGMGGRATGRVTVQSKDAIVEGLTLAYLGTTLLERTTLRLLHGHVYGLVGRNGVGKSTLLRKIYSGTLPGFPPHLKVAQVKQEIPLISDEEKEQTPVEYILQNDPTRRILLNKIEELENTEDDIESSPEEIEASLEKLCTLYELLENEGEATGRATKILMDLGFTQKRRDAPIKELSGGWKMCVSIASAFFQQPNVLLLDEPTNHLVNYDVYASCRYVYC